jgi:hypothetical protein
MEHERVRRRAYEIWEREGRPGGRHDDHWGRAAEEIAAEDGGPSQDPAGGAAPGPDSGLRTPPSAVERGLREAADALRGAGAEEPGAAGATEEDTRAPG